VVIIFWRPLLLIAPFALGFPPLYFLLGKRHGIARALAGIAQDHKTDLVAYFVDRLVAFIKSRPEWLQRINETGLRATLNELLPIYQRRLQNLPFGVRAVVRYFVRRADVAGIVTKAIEAEQIDQLDEERIGAAAARIAESLSAEYFPKPGYAWLGYLAIANVGLATVLKLLL
jgi:hypothetical protein